MATTVPRPSQELNDINIVSPEVAQYFEEVGLFEPPKSNKRKISTSTISHHSAPAHLIDGMGHFTAAAISEVSEFIEIPLSLESVETLEMVGFSQERTELIWNFWMELSPEDKEEIDFLDFILGFITSVDGLKDAINEEDDWAECMTKLGISTRLQAAILLPEYETVRYTASCQFWLVEAVESTYHALESLNQQLEETANYLRSINFKGGERKRLRRAPSPTSRKHRSAKPARDETQSQKSDSEVGTAVGRDQKYDESPDSRPKRPEENKEPGASLLPAGTRTKLYRATDLQRALLFYNQESGRVIEHRFGSLPGDLAGGTKLTYWTPQRERLLIFMRGT
ncbi:hypothetical protein TWF281_006652 [Arthrobotrys megalospora]